MEISRLCRGKKDGNATGDLRCHPMDDKSCSAGELAAPNNTPVSQF